jgi:transcriptional regulator with XRE-family HTH domain
MSGDQKAEPALGRVVRMLREQRGGLTPSALAERANVDLGRLEQIEAGLGGDYNTVVYIRRALGVGAAEFAEMHDAQVRKEEMDAC